MGTPTPTPTGASTTAPPALRTLPDGTVGGEITVGGKPVVGAIVYAPYIVELAVTDKNGFFSFIDLPIRGDVVLKIRATQLVNSGMDIPATSGAFVEVKAAGIRNYNPRKCAEKDRLLNLYVAGVRVRDTYRLAVADQKLLRTKSKKPDKQLSEKALKRALFHARRYLDLSARLPDREVRCQASLAGCTRVDLRSHLRAMKVAVRYLRLESLLFNRRLRFEGLRSQKESDRRVSRVRRNDSRAMSLIKQLAKNTDECS